MRKDKVTGHIYYFSYPTVQSLPVILLAEDMPRFCLDQSKLKQESCDPG